MFQKFPRIPTEFCKIFENIPNILNRSKNSEGNSPIVAL
jgi:hypothetical protein